MDDTITRYQGGTPPGADQKPVNQALQGGGSHGVFAWGVLDKLLEDGRLPIDAMSATSAGAMNAVVTAYGLSIGGVNGAGEKLEEFWRQVSSAGQLYSPVRSLLWETWPHGSGHDLDFSPTFFPLSGHDARFLALSDQSLQSQSAEERALGGGRF
jgi:NTE family protein